MEAPSNESDFDEVAALCEYIYSQDVFIENEAYAQGNNYEFRFFFCSLFSFISYNFFWFLFLILLLYSFHMVIYLWFRNMILLCSNMITSKSVTTDHRMRK